MVAPLLKNRSAVLAGACGAVVVIAAVALLGCAFDWHWGDVPTWVGASATLAALGAAAAGAVGVFRQLDNLSEQVRLQGEALKLQTEQANADRAEADRRASQELEVRRVELRRQAEQVEITPVERDFKPQGINQDVFLALHVENRSDRPIRQVMCRLTINGGYTMPIEVARFANPHGTQAALDRTQRIPLPLLRRDADVDFVFGLVAVTNHGATYTLRFTDDALNHWELTDDMHLIQIADRTDW